MRFVKIIIYILVAIIIPLQGYGFIVQQRGINYGDKVLFHYPTGVIEPGILTPTYYIEENNKGIYPSQIKSIGILFGSNPEINKVEWLDNFQIPQFIEIKGEYYPVCGINGAINFAYSQEWCISDNIITLGDETILYSKDLKKIEFPASLNYLGPRVFSELKSLESIYFRSYIPPACKVTINEEERIISSGVDFELPSTAQLPALQLEKLCNIYVPRGASWLYSQHPYFADGNIIEYDPEYLEVENDHLKGYFYIGNLEAAALHIESNQCSFSQEISSQGYAFGVSCQNNPLKLIIIGPEAVVNKNCTEISIPGSVKMLCDNAFSNLHNVSSITIPESVEYIGSKTFANMNSVVSVIVNSNESHNILCADDAFENTAEHATLYLDNISGKIDLSTAPWNRFKEVRDIEELHSDN